jgi:hypothetical protein
MECAGNAGSAGFGFLRRGESGDWWSRRRLPEKETQKKCSLQDQKKAVGCTLKRTLNSQIEIPIWRCQMGIRLAREPDCLWTTRPVTRPEQLESWSFQFLERAELQRRHSASASVCRLQVRLLWPRPNWCSCSSSSAILRSLTPRTTDTKVIDYEWNESNSRGGTI